MRDTFFIGDIHGNLSPAIWMITLRYKIKDADVIFCGDFGVGFGAEKGMDEAYKEVEKRLEENNIKLWVVRGNHDNPSYFDGLHNYPRLTFLPDHVPFELNGKIYYPVGGATSIDQKERIEANEENIRYGSKKRCWWPAERVSKKYIGLPPKVDIIISHEAPMDFEPVIIREGNFGANVLEGIREDRNYLSWLLRELRPSHWFHGHYHTSSSGDYLGCLYRGLDIDELFMLR